MQNCDWCNIPQEEKQWLLLESPYWSVYLADVQDYVGRCILVLNRHCGSLSELNMQEWTDLKGIIDCLEHCYKEILGAELCNWSCLMNNFYKKSEPNPHLHIHVRPRYKQPVVINDTAYIDEEYGHHYALKKDADLSEEDRRILYRLMKEKLNMQW